MSKDQKNKSPVVSEDQLKAVDDLRKQIKDIQHIININTDDDYLLRFLYSTDFDVSVAFVRMKEYHQNMLDHPDWYQKDSPLKRKTFIDKNISVMVPSACDKSGRPLYLTKLGNVDVQNMKIIDEAILDDIWYEYILDKHPEIAGKGVCMIIDAEEITWKYAKWFNYRDVKLSFKKLASLPFKEFKVHFVSNSRSLKYLMKIVMPFVPEESKKQLYFHFDNWEGLYDHIDKDYIPPEYGGYNKLNYPKIYEKLYEKDEIIAKNFILYRSVTKNEK